MKDDNTRKCSPDRPINITNLRDRPVNITEYHVIREVNVKDFIKKINGLVNIGWKVDGNIVVVVNGNDQFCNEKYFQRLVRTKVER